MCGSANQNQMQTPWRRLQGRNRAPSENSTAVTYDLVSLMLDAFLSTNYSNVSRWHHHTGSPWKQSVQWRLSTAEIRLFKQTIIDRSGQLSMILTHLWRDRFLFDSKTWPSDSVWFHWEEEESSNCPIDVNSEERKKDFAWRNELINEKNIPALRALLFRSSFRCLSTSLHLSTPIPMTRSFLHVSRQYGIGCSFICVTHGLSPCPFSSHQSCC